MTTKTDSINEADLAKKISELQELLREAQAQQEMLAKAKQRRAIDEVRELVSAHNLSWKDVIPGPALRELLGHPAAPLSRPSLKPKGVTATGRKVQVKYRDLEGNTWTGRAHQPLWFREALANGVNPEDLRVR